MRKRGISPLIATVLLIGTTIAIAAIVSTYVIQQTKKFDPEAIVGESTFCQDVVLGLKMPEGGVVCEPFRYEGAECKRITNPILINKGAFTITGVTMSADNLGSSGNVGLEVPGLKGLKSGKKLCGAGSVGQCDVGAGDIPIDTFKLAVCEGGSLRVVPQISVEDKDTVCTQSEMVINYENLGC